MDRSPCRFSLAPCTAPEATKYLCEYCKVPNAHGTFFERDKAGKLVGVERFITDRQRTLRFEKLESERRAIDERVRETALIPTREEYERSLEDAK